MPLPLYGMTHQQSCLWWYPDFNGKIVAKNYLNCLSERFEHRCTPRKPREACVMISPHLATLTCGIKIFNANRKCTISLLS